MVWSVLCRFAFPFWGRTKVGHNPFAGNVGHEKHAETGSRVSCGRPNGRVSRRGGVVAPPRVSLL